MHIFYFYRLHFRNTMADSKPKPTEKPKPGPKRVYSKPEEQPEGKIPPAKPSMYTKNKCLLYHGIHFPFPIFKFPVSDHTFWSDDCFINCLDSY